MASQKIASSKNNFKNLRHSMPEISDGKENGYFSKGSLDPVLKHRDCASPSVHLKSILLLAAAILVKIIPHLPNLSPELVFSIYLTTRWNKWFAYGYVFLMWVLCDLVYAVIYHTQAFGSWTLSTYSAVFAVILFSSYYKNKLNGYWLMGAAGLISLLFWMWTNMGVWLFSSLYPHSLLGLATCYEMALPFLAYALTSAVFWSVVLLIFDIMRFKNHTFSLLLNGVQKCE